jgi:hypothetical protein
MPAARKRHCPALDATIPAKTCGSDRVSRIPCPVSCPFNPFAPEQYDEFGSIELHLIRKKQERLARLALRSGDTWEIEDLAHAPDDFTNFHNQFLLFWRKRNPAGQTFFDAWEAARWDGLNNDEQVLASHFRNAHSAIIEVRRIIDDQSTEVVDLLDPAGKPFVVVDRVQATHSGRFSTFLSFLYKTPHFTRSIGSCIGLPSFAHLDPLDVVRAISAHHGGPRDPAELRAWLDLSASRFADTLTKAADLRFRQSASQAATGPWAYQLTGTPEAVTAILSSHPDAAPDSIADEEIDDGFDDAFRIAPPGADPIGRLLVGPPGLRASSPVIASIPALRSWIDAHLGSSVSLQMHSPQPPEDIPPALMSNAPSLVTESLPIPAFQSTGEFLLAFSQSQTARFFSDPNALLEGQSPEAAATCPRLRPILIRLCKQHINGLDRLRRSAGIDADANEVLARLGLTEIIFPPPPLGEPTGFPTGPATADSPHTTPWVDPELPSLPILNSADRKFFRKSKPPLQKLLSANQIVAGLRSMDRRFQSEDQVIDWLEDEWCDLFDLLLAACRAYRGEILSSCLAAVSQAAWILYAEDFPTESTDAARFTFFLEEATAALREISSIHDEQQIIPLEQTTPQPLLTSGVLSFLTTRPTKAPPALSEPDARLAIPIIIAATRELCMLARR